MPVETLTVLVTVEREQLEPGRYRAKLRRLPSKQVAVFITGRKSGSVALAKKEAESIFGPLDWRAPGPGFDEYVRAIAFRTFYCGPLPR